MPFLELLLHLANTGDTIVSQEAHRISTAQGHVYVRATEGLEQVAGGWTTKYLWVRV